MRNRSTDDQDRKRGGRSGLPGGGREEGSRDQCLDMEESDDRMNGSSWDADESRLKRTWRSMMEEGREREVEVEPEREGDGQETQCE